MESNSFKSDRIYKYGIGTFRLLFLLLAFNYFVGVNIHGLFGGTTLFSYVLFGIGVALLNLHFLSTTYQLVVLVLLILTFLVHLIMSVPSKRLVLVMYLLKTIGGDGLAGKLDQRVWFRSLGIVLGLWLLLSYNPFFPVLPGLVTLLEMLRPYLTVFSLHLICHWICEVGDNLFENVAFCRYRYTYELTSIFLIFVDKSQINAELVLVDMIASLSYRFTNFVYTLFWMD